MRVAVDSPTAHYEEPSTPVDKTDVTPACVEAMCRRGARGFIVLKRRLSARATNGEVSRDGFLASCRDAGISGSDATDAQLRGVVEGLQSQGRAPLRACLEALTPPLTTQRRALAQSAFSRLDVDNLTGWPRSRSSRPLMLQGIPTLLTRNSRHRTRQTICSLRFQEMRPSKTFATTTAPWVRSVMMLRMNGSSATPGVLR